jgi:multidrug efflux system outer membrane protein
MRRRMTAAALLLLFGSGCLVGPDYERPKQDAPQAWRLSDKAAKAVSDPNWWKQYGDPILNDLVKIALEENKDLKIATSRIDQFLGLLETTNAAFYPQVAVGASAGRERVSQNTGPTKLNSIPGSSPTFNQFQIALNASWEIDLWGKLRRASEAARASMLSTVEARKSIRLTLIAAVANSYIALRDLDELLEVTKQTARAYELTNNIIKRRYDHGWVSAMEKNQAQQQYEHAVANIPFYEKAVAQEENNLSVLLGRNPGEIPRGRSVDELAVPVVPASLPSEVLENRPDVRQAEQDLIAANANIGVAKSLYYPSISLTGFFGTASEDISKLFKSASRIWGVAAPVSAPIFTGGSIEGQVLAAEAVQRELVVRYQQVLQNAFREVNDALVDQDRTKAQLSALNRQVEALREYVHLAWVRFNDGYSSYLEVTYSQNLLYTAEQERVAVQRVLFQSYSNLYKAMGIGGLLE